jgi:hypothetical protein
MAARESSTASIHSTSPLNASMRRRDDLEKQGIEALRRLIRVGQNDSGQARRVRAFLIGLYNGPVFPFDLTELRAVDTAIANDALAVLAMDANAPTVEVHQRIPGVSDIIAGWAAAVWPVEA